MLLSISDGLLELQYDNFELLSFQKALWRYYQCAKPCCDSAVFEATESWLAENGRPGGLRNEEPPFIIGLIGALSKGIGPNSAQWELQGLRGLLNRRLQNQPYDLQSRSLRAGRILASSNEVTPNSSCCSEYTNVGCTSGLQAILICQVMKLGHHRADPLKGR